MPEAWSDKDERQYEHIKKSASKSGRSAKTAKRIAAATVNKERSKEGRTKTKSGTAKKSSGGSATKSAATTTSGGAKKSSSGRGKSAGGSSSRAKKAAAGRKGGKAKARKS
jgi:hypothetical protein